MAKLQNGKLIPNPYTNWNQINKNLPNRKISVYGPPSSSGTRDTIEELVMSDVSKIPGIKASIKPYAKMVLISQVVKMII